MVSGDSTKHPGQRTPKPRPKRRPGAPGGYQSRGSPAAGLKGKAKGKGKGKDRVASATEGVAPAAAENAAQSVPPAQNPQPAGKGPTPEVQNEQGDWSDDGNWYTTSQWVEWNAQHCGQIRPEFLSAGHRATLAGVSEEEVQYVQEEESQYEAQEDFDIDAKLGIEVWTRDPIAMIADHFDSDGALEGWSHSPEGLFGPVDGTRLGVTPESGSAVGSCGVNPASSDGSSGGYGSSGLKNGTRIDLGRPRTE